MKVPSTGGSAKCIAKSKGVCREAESEESWRQTTGLTNRNRIRQVRVGKAADQAKAQRLHGARNVDAAGTWSERGVAYLGRSHGHQEHFWWSKACHEKSAEGIVLTYPSVRKARTLVEGVIEGNYGQGKRQTTS